MSLKDTLESLKFAGEEMTAAYDFVLSAPEFTADGLGLTSTCEVTRESARLAVANMRREVALLRYQLVRMQVRLGELEKGAK